MRAARGFAGMTQEELADALGVDAATIKRREAKLGAPNYKGPKKGERLAIAQVCGVPVEFMENGFEGNASSEISERLSHIEAALYRISRPGAVPAALDPPDELRRPPTADRPTRVSDRREQNPRVVDQSEDVV